MNIRIALILVGISFTIQSADSQMVVFRQPKDDLGRVSRLSNSSSGPEEADPEEGDAAGTYNTAETAAVAGTERPQRQFVVYTIFGRRREPSERPEYHLDRFVPITIDNVNQWRRNAHARTFLSSKTATTVGALALAGTTVLGRVPVRSFDLGSMFNLSNVIGFTALGIGCWQIHGLWQAKQHIDEVSRNMIAAHQAMEYARSELRGLKSNYETLAKRFDETRSILATIGPLVSQAVKISGDHATLARILSNLIDEVDQMHVEMQQSSIRNKALVEENMRHLPTEEVLKHLSQEEVIATKMQAVVEQAESLSKRVVKVREEHAAKKEERATKQIEEVRHGLLTRIGAFFGMGNKDKKRSPVIIATQAPVAPTEQRREPSPELEQRVLTPTQQDAQTTFASITNADSGAGTQAGLPESAAAAAGPAGDALQRRISTPFPERDRLHSDSEDDTGSVFEDDSVAGAGSGTGIESKTATDPDLTLVQGSPEPERQVMVAADESDLSKVETSTAGADEVNTGVSAGAGAAAAADDDTPDEVDRHPVLYKKSSNPWARLAKHVRHHGLLPKHRHPEHDAGK